MQSRREVVEHRATFIISREFNTAHHEDPQRRGGYLLLLPGRIPEIVLDGLATNEEQHQAMVRCQRELDDMLVNAQIMANADLATEDSRGEVLTATSQFVVVRRNDPVAHADPQRRGGYIVREQGKIPTIVIDGMAGRPQQEQAEQHLRGILEREHTVQRLRASLHRTGQPIRAAVPPTPTRRAAAQASLTPPAPKGVARPTPAAPRGAKGPPGDAAKGSTKGAPVGAAPAPAPARQHLQIGAILVQRGHLSPEDLTAALTLQGALPDDLPHRRLGTLLVDTGKITLAQVSQALSEQRWVQAAPPHLLRVDPPLRALFPLDLLEEVAAAPLYQLGKTVVVAMCDPHLRDQVLHLQDRTHLLVRPVQAPQLQIERMLASLRKS